MDVCCPTPFPICVVWLIKVCGGGGGVVGLLVGEAIAPLAESNAWPDNGIERGMLSQGGLPCDKRSIDSEGRSTPPSEPVKLLIIVVT